MQTWKWRQPRRLRLCTSESRIFLQRKEFIRMLRKKICGLTFCLGFERWQSITPEEGIHGRAWVIRNCWRVQVCMVWTLPREKRDIIWRRFFYWVKMMWLWMPVLHMKRMLLYVRSMLTDMMTERLFGRTWSKVLISWWILQESICRINFFWKM